MALTTGRMVIYIITTPALLNFDFLQAFPWEITGQITERDITIPHENLEEFIILDPSQMALELFRMANCPDPPSCFLLSNAGQVKVSGHVLHGYFFKLADMKHTTNMIPGMNYGSLLEAEKVADLVTSCEVECGDLC